MQETEQQAKMRAFIENEQALAEYGKGFKKHRNKQTHLKPKKKKRK